MSQSSQLNAYQKPPYLFRSLFKKYQKLQFDDLDLDNGIINLSRGRDSVHDQLTYSPESFKGDRQRAFRDFLGPTFDAKSDKTHAFVHAYEVEAVPGLYVLPNLLSPTVQLALLHRLLHRDLSNPDHRTNVHLHHRVPYQPVPPLISAPSFFCQNKALTFPSKDPTVHRPITVTEFLEKKLRWMTIGGQYDWTAKSYPSEEPPPFPADIKHLVQTLFPETDAQAAIVNFYSPCDTLNVHRDVSEYCNHGLVSISLGCDGIFIVGNQDGSKTATLRLSSGDAVYMTGVSRYAWHGVPKIIPDTCPRWLADWPAVDSDEKEYGEWKGWMNNKRVNLNVRQMMAE